MRASEFRLIVPSATRYQRFIRAADHPAQPRVSNYVRNQVRILSTALDAKEVA